MKQIHITILASAAALIAGATAGYLYGKKELKDITKQYEDQLDRLSDDMGKYEEWAYNEGYQEGENNTHAYYKNLEEKQDAEVISQVESLFTKDKEPKKAEVIVTSKEERDKNRVLYNQRINRLDYAKPSLSDIYDTLQLHPEDDEPEDEEAYEEPPIEQPRNAFIFQITPKEFFEEMNHYEKLTITYYEGDNTLADERDGVIPDANELIGAVPLTDDVTYIRNNRRSSDFEVVRVEEGYVEVVLGHRPVDEESFHVMRKKAHYGEI